MKIFKFLNLTIIFLIISISILIIFVLRKNINNIHPIGFSIPEKKIVTYVPNKTKKFATIIPGDLKTYVFNTEFSYYNDYRNSIFGKTTKKAGWDCMRHYEILANGCIPYFENISNCPKNVMTFFPKELVSKAMNSDNPSIYTKELLEYTKNHLTTKAMAQYIINTVHKEPNNLVFLSGEAKPDYLCDLTLIGLKEIYGKRCAEEVSRPYIYDDYKEDTSKLYGKGFSYTKILSSELRNTNVNEEQIKNKNYDLVVYGSVHRGMPYWDLVQKVYKKDQVVLICGEDIHSLDSCPAMIYGKKGYNAFIRELII
jgi:hypothetical protein